MTSRPTRSAAVLLAALALAACTRENTVAREILRSCESGSAAACDSIALRFAKGRYVLRDAARAASLYEQACTGGIGDACASLGGMYQRATGVKADTARAAALYAQGCDKGGMAGCASLGVMHVAGIGLPRDV